MQVEFLHKFLLVSVYLEGFRKQNEWSYCFVNFIFSRVTVIGPQNSSQKDYILFARFLQELIKQKKLETSPLMKLVNYQTSHLAQNICISVYLYNVLENFQGYIFTHA